MKNSSEIVDISLIVLLQVSNERACRDSTMIGLIALCSIIVLQLSGVSATCDACIRNECYQKIIVLERFNQIGQIAIDRTSNFFYFHVKDDKQKSYTCAYDLDHIDLHRIYSLDFTFARAVDQVSRDVYISEEKGVYKTNPINNFTEGETVFDATVWHMQYKDKLYYSEFVGNGIKTYENGQHKSIQGLSQYKVDDFIVDKNDDIYFLSDFAVYRLKNGANEATLFADEIYSLTTDKKDEAYFIQPFVKGIYKLDYSKDELIEIGAFRAGVPFKAVFTSDNDIIYSDSEYEGMYYLIRDEGTCVVKEEGTGMSATKKVIVD